jgi:hypothetical protein
MKSLRVIIGLLSLLLAGALPAHAREAEGLYQAEVPVKGQGRDERLTVYPAALAQVVVKLTGDRSAPQSPRLAKALGSAQNMVQQYSYQELALPALKGQGYSRLLLVQFDEKALNQVLVAAGLPLWGRTRPDLLVLLAVEDGASRMLLAANDVTAAGLEWGGALDANARRRGLPLLLPALDGAEQKRLGFADLWNNVRPPIMDAAKRYGANAVLVGRINRQGSGWQGRWSLYQGEEVQHWAANGSDQNSVVAAGIDAVADRFGQRYAQLMTAGTADQLALQVADVSTLADYARVQHYLLSLDLVTKAQVAKVEGDAVLFLLDLRGDLNSLDRAIALGGTLRRATATATATENQLPVYQLLP